MLQNKQRKLLLKVIPGLLLFIWMVYTIYHQIRNQPNLSDTLITLRRQLNGWPVLLLCVVIFLMPVNWSIETLKWQRLIRSTEHLSFQKAFQSVLSGLSVSMITPNRIGEYMGRVLFLRNSHKIQGITVTIIGSFAQFIVTSSFGFVGTLVYLIFVDTPSWVKYLLMISMVLSAIGLYVYLHLDQLFAWILRQEFLRKIRIYLLVVRRFDRKDLWTIIGLSVLRYIVYTFQFLLLLYFFLIDINGWLLVPTIWLIFWAMAMVPTLAIAEVGIRGETALFFLLPLTVNSLGVISSTALLWLINLIVPALFGCLFTYRIRWDDDDSLSAS